MIRENALFMLVKGEIEYRTAKYAECLKTMEVAFEIPGVKDLAKPAAQKLQKQKTMKTNPKP